MALEHAAGQTRFASDYPLPPGTLFAWPVSAPHAHAEVVSIDLSLALDFPGVIWVLTASDLSAAATIGAIVADEPVFPQEVCYHSQPVAWVLANSARAARAGAARVRVTYRPLPARLSLEAGILAQDFLSPLARMSRGAGVRGLARAPLRLAGEVKTPFQEHAYFETQTALALPEPGGIRVISSTQHPAEVQEAVAQVLGLPLARVVVEAPPLGGAFGGKESQAAPYAAIAALGAWRTGKPVFLKLSRQLDFALTGKRDAFLARFRVGFTAAGQIMAFYAELFSDGGAYTDLSPSIMDRALYHLDNAYYLADFCATGRVVRTNHPPSTAFRGFGGPQGMVVIEEAVAQVSNYLNIPPEVVRRQNLYRLGQRAPYGQEIKDERIVLIWDQLLANSDFTRRREEVINFNQANSRRKRGIALTPVKFGISFTNTRLNQAGALVQIYRDGSVLLHSGGIEMGQGLAQRLIRLAERELGVAVHWSLPRTDVIPNTSATAASAGADLNGQAVLAACRELKARLAGVATGLLNSHPDDLVFQEGKIYPLYDPANSLAWPELCHRAWQGRVSLSATGFYRTPGLGPGRPFAYYAYGAAVSELEVDCHTGEFQLLRVDILEDVGSSGEADLDRGQIAGGFIQGLGWLREELVWDSEGHLLTNSFERYKIPGIMDLPSDFRITTMTTPAPEAGVLGSKAVGEPPLMLAISVREALRMAIGSYHPGAKVPFPATPEQVLLALEAQGVLD